jgi:hypothetical protein
MAKSPAIRIFTLNSLVKEVFMRKIWKSARKKYLPHSICGPSLESVRPQTTSQEPAKKKVAKSPLFPLYCYQGCGIARISTDSGSKWATDSDSTLLIVR